MRLSRLLQICALSFTLSLACHAQPSSPDTPAARQLTNWLAAFDKADTTAYRSFIQQKMSPVAAAQAPPEGLRRNTAGFDILQFDQQSATTVSAFLQERASDGLARITVEVEPTEPFRIVRLAIEPIFERSPQFALPHLAQSRLIHALRQRLQQSTAADLFSGAVLFAANGKPVFQQAYGLADREHSRPNTLETRFSIASLNKMFSAVAIMQLVQTGKLKLDDPVGKYLTGYPNRELAAKVTIAECLNHTAGTGDIFGPEFDKHRAGLRTLQDYINLYGSRPLRFEPGSRFEYSNYGYILLGAVIEKVSGETYDNYVREHVYAPAALTATGAAPQDQPVEDRSVAYTRSGSGDWTPMQSFPTERGTSAGGGYSTVGDLLRFAMALREYRLLDAEHTRLLTTGTIKTSLGQYANGFEVRSLNGSTCFGHGGVSSGVNSELQVCANSRYIIVVLANMDPPAAMRVTDFIANRLPIPANPPASHKPG